MEEEREEILVEEEVTPETPPHLYQPEFEETRYLLLITRGTLLEIRVAVAVHPAKILHQPSETTTPLLLI